MASVQVELAPVVPQRRNRDSYEVIDVDSFGDDEIQDAQRRIQRRRLESHQRRERTGVESEDVIIIESDDDEPVASSSQAVEFHRRRLPLPRHFTRYTSPPPPRPGVYIPPVPPVPHRYASLQSMPHRRHAHIPSGVVRPNQEPFGFESNITSNGRQVRLNNAPSATPPSHHLPSMGLGGALIAMNRREDELAERARHRHNVVEEGFHLFNYPSLSQAASRLSDSIQRLAGYPPRRRNIEDDRAEALAWLLEDEINPLFAGSYDVPSFTADLRRQFNSQPDYNPSFTHLTKPSQGFTKDFAPGSPEELSSSSSSNTGPVAGSSKDAQEEASTLLICGRCLDPLSLGTGGDSQDRKLWGLRCGHVLDGKCLKHIMSPPVIDGKPSIEDTVMDVVKPEVNDEDSSLNGLPYHNRLRSRARKATPHPRPVVPRPPRVNFKNFKGKAKVEEYSGEKLYEWTCPIPGCARVHQSTFVDGKWVVDKERGAIGIFA